MTAVAAPAPLDPHRFRNAAEWLRSLGGVPLERIIFDPWPGTATEADLLSYVERGDQLCELIDGTLVEKPVGYWEARIATNLLIPLGSYVGEHDLGSVSGADTTLRLPVSDRIRLPDACFISKGREPTSPRPVPVVSPDLAVEVLSEGNTAAEMDQKRREYFESGTRLAWFINPRDRTVSVYRSAAEPLAVLGEADVLDGQDVVPGFTLPVARLFRNIAPPA